MKKILTLALTAAAVSGAFAQCFPSKPITLVVPFAAGGPTDLVARQLAESMRKPLQRPSISCAPRIARLRTRPSIPGTRQGP